MEKVIVMLVVMAVFVLLAFGVSTWAAWRLLRWSRRRAHHRSRLGLGLAVGLAMFCVGMILFRWSFSFSRTVNGVGTNLHGELGWLFLLPLGLTVAAIVIWSQALRSGPAPEPWVDASGSVPGRMSETSEPARPAPPPKISGEA